MRRKMSRLSFLPSKKFEILMKLGSGNFGTVWKAKNHHLGRIEAVKEIREDDQQKIESDFNEARNLQSLSASENIVKVYDAGFLEEEKGVFIQMEYLKRGNISSLGFISIRRFKDIFLDVSRGLEYAHLRGFVHRDIKPKNILLTDSGTAKLSDFGLAARATIGIGASPARYIYTLHTAPELISGGPATKLTDVYALGVTMHRVINGDPLEWERMHPEEFYEAVLDGRLPRRDCYRPDTPLPLGKLIDKALEIDPRNRFQSVRELREELDNISVKCEWIKKEETKEKVEWNGLTANKTIQVIYYPQDRKIITKSGKLSGKLRNITNLCYGNLGRSEGNYRLSLILRGFTSGKYT